MRSINISSIKIKPIEVFLGLGLGLGYMTSLRFAGFVGISELFVLLTLVLLIKNHGLSLVKFELNFAGLIKIYMLASIFVVMPIMTIITAIFTDYNSSPQYVISFMMGGALSFLIVESLREHRIDMSNVVLWFAFSFIMTSLVSIFIFNSAHESARYSGAANNPNQLMFYASCLSLLLVIYRPKLSFLLLPVVVFITSKSGSDAYFLSIFVTAVFYLFGLIIFSWRISFGVGFLLSFVLIVLIFSYVLINFGNDIILLWSLADEGNARTNLMLNALSVSLSSPFFGYGVGSFSGIDHSFSTWEAHNTFLDLSMQFGFVFPLIVYSVFFYFLVNRIKNRLYLQSSFVAAFIVSSVFHFTGRHFFFWVEFAVFYYSVFYREKDFF